MFDFGFHFFGNSRGSTPPPTPITPEFIIKVKTDNTGPSEDNQFTLPTTTGTYDYTIDWGDGVVENITSSTSQTHTYATAGEYVITISGTFPRIFFNNGGDRLKLIETINFGDVGWVSMTQAFWGCANNIINENCTGNFENVDLAFRAWQGNNLTFFPAIDMPSCTNIRGCWAFNSLKYFPKINLNSVQLVGDGFNQGAWQNNDLDYFPDIDLPNATDFRNAWANNGVIISFDCRNFFNMGAGFGRAQNCFLGTTLPTSDYSDILITQRANNNNNDVTFHGGNSKYNTAGGIARDELTDTVANGGQNWSITDGGEE